MPLSTIFLQSGLLWLLAPVALHGALKDGMTSWVPAFVQNTFAVTPSFSVVLSMTLPAVNVSGAYWAMWLGFALVAPVFSFRPARRWENYLTS